MMKTEIISGNVLRVVAPRKLYVEDFQQITPDVDSFISQHGKIKLLVDVSNFHGWSNAAALLRHIRFVKDHHQKVERIAVVGARNWQHWVIGVVRVIAHPEVRAYDKSQQSEALRWIVG
jgi:hypothetical protein